MRRFARRTAGVTKTVFRCAFIAAALNGCTVKAPVVPDIWASIQPGEPVPCDVIVVGGSLAGYTAALSAAREGAYTCLLEPSRNIGGQLTAQGVSAVDFANYTIDDLDVTAMARSPANQSRELASWLSQLGDPGKCWVSPWCFPTESAEILAEQTAAAERRLRIFRQTVVSGVSRRASARTGVVVIDTVTGVQRVGSDRAYFLSDVLAEWYDPLPSAHYPEKAVLKFVGRDSRLPVVVDASVFGDALVLSGARWLQGADGGDGAASTLDDTCGAAIVFPFALRWAFEPTSGASWVGLPSPAANDPRFSLGTAGWNGVWTYRRLVGGQDAPGAGDLSMQNWNPGNDYPGGYFLLSISATRAQAASGWRGGANLRAIRAAEEQALAYAAWYRSQAPAEARDYLEFSRTWGNSTGLAEMPYVRDGRRAIGLDDFVLAGSSFLGPAAQRTGTVWPDRIAIGAYRFDFRALRGCKLPQYATTDTPLPYYIPFRALTSADVGNLLVAGKNMAQSTLAGASTRMHPTEWNTGIAAGVAAAWMSARSADSREALESIADIQSRIRHWAPLEWRLLTR